MKPQSAKAKGRRFQQWCRDIFLSAADSLEPDDIRSTSMGAGGEDLLFSPAARKIFPYSIECKRTEKMNMWDAIKQACANSGKFIPMVIFRKSQQKAWIAMPLEDFMEIQHGLKKEDF